MRSKGNTYKRIGGILTILICICIHSQGLEARGQGRTRLTRSRMIVTGEGKEVRAFSAFKGALSEAKIYTDMVNTYRRLISDSVQLYCMPIPTAGAFYTPESMSKWSSTQEETLEAIREHLSPDITFVAVRDTLSAHADEPIYLRTDHHWAPLGAYYAAHCFAKCADVPYLDLSEYDEYVLHGFVGTMARYTKDPAIRRAPEDFVYHKPKGIEHTTTYITYTLDRKRTKAIKASAPEQRDFYRQYRNGDKGAYCTFLGGDNNNACIRTSTKNGRHLLILKDSFGNALPAYLMGSFEEIHVVDCRYFLGNILTYIRDKKITDLLFANNLSHLTKQVTVDAYLRYLKQ